MRNLKISTSNGAIIMAAGILVNIPIARLAWVPDSINSWITVYLLGAAGFLVFLYVLNAIAGKFRESHTSHPITSFAIGTWVAGISVIIVAMQKTFPSLYPWGKALYLFNVILWLGYLALMIRNYVILIKNKELRKQTHGVLLLSCVSTQSLAISGKMLYGDHFSDVLSILFMVIGVLLYSWSMVFIVQALVHTQFRALLEKWRNTNCIIHGALSITGLAAVTSGVVPDRFTLLLWQLVLALFVIVETIELVRAGKRIQHFGLNKAIFSYSVSQWSRNFTFGMFLAFTISMPKQHSQISMWTNNPLISLALYAVILLLLIEYILMAAALAANFPAFKVEDRNRRMTS